jgi:hypothetical protein
MTRYTICSAPVAIAEFRLQGKEPLRRSRHRRKDNLKVGIGEIGCDDVNFIGQAQYGGVAVF